MDISQTSWSDIHGHHDIVCYSTVYRNVYRGRCANVKPWPGRALGFLAGAGALCNVSVRARRPRGLQAGARWPSRGHRATVGHCRNLRRVTRVRPRSRAVGSAVDAFSKAEIACNWSSLAKGFAEERRIALTPSGNAGGAGQIGVGVSSCVTMWASDVLGKVLVFAGVVTTAVFILVNLPTGISQSAINARYITVSSHADQHPPLPPKYVASCRFLTQSAIRCTCTFSQRRLIR